MSATIRMNAQEGTVTVNQSPEIDKLLNLKKDPQYRSSLEYETPNYKIWVGNFRSRLEADRALVKVKRKFTSAFIFKPGK